MINPFDFSGKKFLVTGASSGIGKSTAIALSKQGAQVVIVSRRLDKLNETLKLMEGDNHIAIPVDLGEEEDLTPVFDAAVADGKKLNGFVHCAGNSPVLPISAVNRKKITECMSVNFYTYLELTRLFTKKKYREDEGCSIVGISSITVDMPSKCQSIYAGSKGAMNAATKSLAIELAAKNIRINCVQPGATETEMYQEFVETTPLEKQQEMLRYQVLGLTQPVEIANAVMFLLSDASSASTGRVISADGGKLGIW